MAESKWFWIAWALLVVVAGACYHSGPYSVGHLAVKTGHVNYHISTEFSTEHRELIEKSISYFSHDIGCLEFSELPELPERDYLVLKFRPMRKKRGKQIGRFDHNTQAIVLSVEESNDMMFKCSIHEIAHAMGMYIHAYPEIFREESMLTPEISKYSKRGFYTKDLKFLRRMICRNIP